MSEENESSSGQAAEQDPFIGTEVFKDGIDRLTLQATAGRE